MIRIEFGQCQICSDIKMKCKKTFWYLFQLGKSHPFSLVKFKIRQKMKFGFRFFQDLHHCLGVFCRRFGYYSQNGQDYFLDRYVFKGKRSGYFIDIGTFEPVMDNATYFFEKNRGWTGIAIEPQMIHVDKWQKLRSTPIVHAACSSQNGNAEFLVIEHPQIMNYNAWSGISSTIGKEKIVQLPNGAQQTVVTVPKKTLKDIINSHSVSKIDFLSIDVEGHELEVLKGIDFENHEIRCIVIENDLLPEGDPIIHNYIIDKGYKYIARLTSDDIFLKK